MRAGGHYSLFIIFIEILNFHLRMLTTLDSMDIKDLISVYCLTILYSYFIVLYLFSPLLGEFPLWRQ